LVLAEELLALRMVQAAVGGEAAVGYRISARKRVYCSRIGFLQMLRAIDIYMGVLLLAH